MTQQSRAKDKAELSSLSAQTKLMPLWYKYNFVLYIPEIIHRKFRVTDTGKVILDLKINPVKKLLGKLVNREPVADLQLDELSSLVWLNMDGRRSILEIARIQSKKTGDDIDEAVRRIVQFMRYLATRGWIKFKLAEHKPHSRNAFH